MPLEHFKTQVLLLHSEQSKLDTLSSGFNDRYAVHCATSGTEALNIFGDTPIHVIVSAQELPGMSGLDALREAKKRSPETIAILLAGTDPSDGLEALVSDQEVFQVVRGEITPDALENLIDSATKSVRLLALSEASNDTAANVDEPYNEDDSEHIVMETAENGSVIISDGTGTLPVLKPNKIQVSPNAGGQNVDVLVLTQDEEFLSTILESSRGMHHVHHVVTPNQAEDIARTQSIGVLVTDAAMIGSNIENLTQRLRAHAPRLVAIVAGRRDDGELLMDLINRGQVYRFLLKPVSPGRARLAIEASVKRHLEAADSSFKPKSGAAPKPQKKAAQAPKPTAPQSAQKTPAPAAPNAQRTERRAARQPAPQTPSAANTSATGMQRALPNAATPGLDDAFDEPASFTETVAGLAASVGKSFAKKSNDGPASTQSAPVLQAAAEEPSGIAKHGKLIALGIAALAGVAIAVGILTGDDAPPAAPNAGTPTIAQSEPPAPAPAPESVTPAPAAAATSALFDSALQQARDAQAAGNVYAPAGDNAVEYYLAALDLAPDSAEAQGELDDLLTEVFNLAEQALLENRSEDASAALRVIFLTDPENPRLAFLNAQLSQQQFRERVVETRDAIRAARFEDAATLLAQAEATVGADAEELEALRTELADARSEQRLDDVLQTAAARLNADQLIAPANDNARYYYQLALSSDSGNAAAQQGLIAIASKLVLQARSAIDEGNYAVAESLLAEARPLDPASSELAASAAALQAARDAAQARADAELQAQAEAAAAREAEAERIAAEQRAAAERAAQAAASTPANAAAEEAATPEAAPQAAAARVANAAESAADSDAVTANTGTELVSISSLERTKYVAPRYPRSAQRRNTSGYVDLVFTVTAAGSVDNVEVTDSRPGSLFDGAAIEAVERWEFNPALENGVAVPKRVAVRLSFALE